MKAGAVEEAEFSSERLNQIRPAMQSLVDQKKIPGLLTLLARNGNIVHFERYGMMDLEAERPMRTDTIFRIYSMTKPITASAVMMLCEKGLLRLDDPVSKFIPAFSQIKVYHTNGELAELEREITVHDLMTHTAGLTYGFLEESPVDAMYQAAKLFTKDVSLQDSVYRLLNLPLVYQPGAAWRYSVSSDVLGFLVEVVTGIPFDVFLDEHIFRPLGMHDTDFYVPHGKTDRLASMYYTTADGSLSLMEQPKVSKFSEKPISALGGGGLVSTITDYFRFASMLLNRGELNGVRVLKPESISLMTSNHLPDALIPIGISGLKRAGYGYGYGLGIVVDPKKTEVRQSAGNYGWSGVAGTYFWNDPAKGIIGILMMQLNPSFQIPTAHQFKELTYGALLD